MKTNMNTSFKSTPFETHLKSIDLKNNPTVTDFRVPVLFNNRTQEEVQPPIHVWEKIARRLDEQEKNKNKIPANPDCVFFS